MNALVFRVVADLAEGDTAEWVYTPWSDVVIIRCSPSEAPSRAHTYVRREKGQLPRYILPGVSE